MHADDADPPAVIVEIGDGRAARLEVRQCHRRGRSDGDRLARQDDVAVVAQALWPLGEADGAVVGLLLDLLGVERGDARTKAAVDLLQRDDIGIDLVDHAEDARGAPPPIKADGLADVVRRDLELHGKKKREAPEWLRGYPAAAGGSSRRLAVASRVKSKICGQPRTSRAPTMVSTMASSQRMMRSSS